MRSLIRLGKRLSNIKRLNRIFMLLITHGFGDVVSRLNLDAAFAYVKALATVKAKRTATAELSVYERIRHLIEDLGPTFVKLGQMMATRPDMFPPAMITELRKLHDEVAPFPWEQVVSSLDAELKRPHDEVFSEIEKTSIAAASMAQVHRGMLKDGRVVAVKIQRPGITGTIRSDLFLLRYLAELMTRQIPELERFDPIGMAEQLEAMLTNELDFTNEVYAMLRFAKQFEKNDKIRVPKPVEALCTERLIVMNFVGGIRITDSAAMASLGLSGRDVIRTGTQAILESIFTHGFFHADPHPGNFFVQDNGALCILDFGIVGAIGRERIDELLYLLAAIIMRDLDLLTYILLEMEVVGEDTNLRRLKNDLGAVLDCYYNTSLEKINLSDFITKIVGIFSTHTITLPSDLMLVLRTLAILEGVAYQVVPDFNPIEELKPFIMEAYTKRLANPKEQTKFITRTFHDVAYLLRTLPVSLRKIIGKIEKNEFKIKVEDTEQAKRSKAADKRVNRLIILVIAVALFAFCFYCKNVDPSLLGGNLPVLGIATSFILFIILFIAIWRSGGV